MAPDPAFGAWSYGWMCEMCMIDDSTKVVILHEGSGVLTSVHFRCMYEMERFICPYGRGYYRQKKFKAFMLFANIKVSLWLRKPMTKLILGVGRRSGLRREPFTSTTTLTGHADLSNWDQGGGLYMIERFSY